MEEVNYEMGSGLSVYLRGLTVNVGIKFALEKGWFIGLFTLSLILDF